LQPPQGAAQVGPQGAAQVAGAQQVGAGAQQLDLQQLPRRLSFLNQPASLRHRCGLQQLTGAQQACGAGAQQAGAAGAQAGWQGAAQAGSQALPQGAAQVGPHAFPQASPQAEPQGAAQVGPQAFPHALPQGAAQLGAVSQHVGAGAQHEELWCLNRPASAKFELTAISKAAVKVVHFILKSPNTSRGL